MEMIIMNSFSPVNITINLDKLKYNIQHSLDLCKDKSIQLAFVSKSICGDEHIMAAVEETDAEVIADSRLDNFAKMNTTKTKMLIRPAVAKEAEAVVSLTDISFQTELDTIKTIEEAAVKQNKTHDIILMIDIGDLRDGIQHTDRETIYETAKYVHESKNLRLVGIAANYNCFLGLLPDSENMSTLAEVFNSLKPLYDIDTPILSGGTSSSVSLLTDKDTFIPSEINQIRMGEAIMLGRDPSDNTFIDGYATDVFTLEVPIIEVHKKKLSDDTEMLRGVLAIGKQDLQIDRIIPYDERIKILGACSDECVIDLSAAPEYKSGDTVKFMLEYGALMTAFAGQFINKIYL